MSWFRKSEEVNERAGEVNEEERVKNKSEKAERARKVAERVQQQINSLVIMDKLDEELIRKMEVEYQAADELPLIYEVKTKSGVRRQLTFAGWIMAARMQRNIHIEAPEFREVNGRLVATAYAVDLERNIRIPGQSSRSFTKDYEIEVLSAKAIRNALRRVIDPNIVEQVIRYALERKAIKTIELREYAEP